MKEELKILWKMLSKLDDYLLEKSKVVENTRNRLDNANGGTGNYEGDVLINQVKDGFFSNWEKSKELMSNAKNIYDVIKEGKFMSIRI